MNAQPNHLPLESLRGLYDDIELAILHDWLQIPRPALLADIDLQGAFYDEEPAAGPIRLLPGPNGGTGEYTLSNAVARLLLSEIQNRLPQWAAVRANGDVILARHFTPRRRGKLQPLPRFLFMINWADSGPGFSWPESYHVAYLPGFERYVVTASQDSPDMHGYTDEAIGHFPQDEDVESGVHRVITGWWQGQLDGGDQQRWEYLFDVGEIDAETAEQWADEVWPPYEEDEDSN
jgi:hypothetical protein